MDTVIENSQDTTSKFRPSRNDAPRVAAYLVIIFLLWQYFTKFFSLSKEIIDSIAFSVIVNDIQLNESYYSLSETIWVLGPIFLLFFTFFFDFEGGTLECWSSRTCEHVLCQISVAFVRPGVCAVRPRRPFAFHGLGSPTK